MGIEPQHDAMVNWETSWNANRALGVIRRRFGKCQESIKETLYTTMVRPHLEYAPGARNPYFKNDINKLFYIQRKVSKFINICNSRDPGIATSLLADLEWKSLKHRRTQHDVTLFYQATLKPPTTQRNPCTKKQQKPPLKCLQKWSIL